MNKRIAFFIICFTLGAIPNINAVFQFNRHAPLLRSTAISALFGCLTFACAKCVALEVKRAQKWNTQNKIIKADKKIREAKTILEKFQAYTYKAQANEAGKYNHYVNAIATAGVTCLTAALTVVPFVKVTSPRVQLLKWFLKRSQGNPGL